MQLHAIARLPGIAASRVSAPALDLRAITADSRRAGPGVAFFALPGARADGHRFLDDALRAGAPALFLTDPAAYARLAERPPEGLAGLFLAREERPTLAEVAAAIYGDPSRRMALLGVTGTNGKTTVTHIAAQMWEALGYRCAVSGTLGMWVGGENLGAALTTPEAPDLQAFLARCLAEGVETAAMEASSVGIAQARTHALRFRAAAFTNLTPDHLDVHADMAAYREAKYRLFTEHEVGTAVLNGDDPTGRDFAERLRARAGAPPVVTFALEGPADLRAEPPRWDAEGMHSALLAGGRRYPFRAPLLGRYNCSNLLAAMGLLLAASAEPGALAGAASAARGAPGRLEQVPVPNGVIVLVDYAHTPDALQNVLGAVRPLVAGRLWVVFGCGGDRDAAKRPVMGALAERLADRVVLTSDNPRSEPPGAILHAIATGLRDPAAARQIESREEAIRWALGWARPGDLVLIAGKGHETYQEVAGRRLPFSDQAVVRAWAEGS